MAKRAQKGQISLSLSCWSQIWLW